MKRISRQREVERTHREKQKVTVEVAPGFQELVSKRLDKWPEAIKLKQTVLPTVRDRKLKDRQMLCCARKLCPGKKKKKQTQGHSLYFTLLKK